MCGDLLLCAKHLFGGAIDGCPSRLASHHSGFVRVDVELLQQLSARYPHVELFAAGGLEAPVPAEGRTSNGILG